MPFDPRPCAAGLRRLNERERERTAQRAVTARARAADLARRIGEHDSMVRCVYLFGSLQREVPRNPDFDIDLALDGGISIGRWNLQRMWSLPLISSACSSFPLM